MTMFRHEWSSVSLLIILWLLLGAATSLADNVKTVIDDSDPNIHYNGNWTHINGSIFYNSTESVARLAGCTATYTFNGALKLSFSAETALILSTGTEISVFGTLCYRPGTNTTIVSSYSIDNETWSKFTEPSGVNCPQSFFNFYTSPPLENGQHTLVITNLNDGTGYFLDYLEVVTPGPTPSTTTPSVASSSASSSTGPATGPPHIGIIVGSAFGAAGLMVFGTLVLILLWRKLRQKCQNSENGPWLQRGDPEGITAYTVPHSTATLADLANLSNANTKISASTTTLPPSSTAVHPNLDNASPSQLAPVAPRQTTSAMPPAYSTDL